jgi:hypothetical protein
VTQKLDLLERLANRAIELGEFDIEFVPWNTIKGLALANFLTEFMNLSESEEAMMERKWVIYVDGSSTRKNGVAEILLITLDKEELSGSLRLEFKTTNNKAKYEAVIAGLGMAFKL